MNSEIETNTQDDLRKYKKGRIGFITNEAAHSMGGNFLAVTYLSAMLLYWGVSESLIALNVSLIYLAGLAMGAAPYMTFFFKHPKVILSIGVAVQILPLPFLFMFPMFGLGPQYFPLLAMVYCLSNIVGNILSPMYSEMRQYYAERGGETSSFYSWNSTVVNGMTFLAYVIITILSTRYEKVNPTLFYFLLGLFALVSFVLRIILILTLIGKPKLKPTTKPGNILSGTWGMLCDKQYRPYMVYGVFLTIGPALISGVETVFFVDKMGLTVSFISLMNVVTLLGRMVVSPIIGKVGRVFGNRRSLAISVFLVSSCYLVNIIMTPENAIALRIIANIIGIIGFAGTGIYAVPFQFQCMPEDKHISYMSFIQIVASGLSFLFGLFVSGIVKWSAGLSFMVMGMEITNVHLLYLGSAILQVIPAIYLLKDRKKN